MRHILNIVPSRSGRNRSRAWLALALFLVCSWGTQAGWAVEYGFAPVSGQLTSHFGWRVDPLTGSQRFHGGIDLAAASGTPVYAPQAGLVMFSGYYGGYGNVVVLSHGNSLFTLYGHNSQLLVRPGDVVYRGQVISKVGSTGRSTGPHLHFEVHHNGQYVNPVTYLSYLQPGSGAPLMAQARPLQTSRVVASTAAQPMDSDSGVQTLTVKHVNRKSHRNYTTGKSVELVSGNRVQTVQF
ncbi:M23 family metallopeptidase [Vampirovibrio chlorellavorus]|uniref:M23 family metallopeptidase n=1 Tax=Vampirovibrio chlorellavorus TaxID=758823 RepID=UPI0026ED2715|nr:M23 family metallopeptidase [Vampirovibrio chlorellavorus]